MKEKKKGLIIGLVSLLLVGIICVVGYFSLFNKQKVEDTDAFIDEGLSAMIDSTDNRNTDSLYEFEQKYKSSNYKLNDEQQEFYKLVLDYKYNLKEVFISIEKKDKQSMDKHYIKLQEIYNVIIEKYGFK